jgi:hypothetical protein
MTNTHRALGTVTEDYGVLESRLEMVYLISNRGKNGPTVGWANGILNEARSHIVYARQEPREHEHVPSSLIGLARNSTWAKKDKAHTTTTIPIIFHVGIKVEPHHYTPLLLAR